MSPGIISIIITLLIDLKFNISGRIADFVCDKIDSWRNRK